MQAERLEHDATKKSLKESKEKIDDLIENVRDANKRYNQLQDELERFVKSFFINLNRYLGC